MVEAKDFRRDIDAAFGDEPRKGKKYWALMLFFTEMELGMSATPNRWVNTNNVFYADGISALNAYAETKCPASQLVDGKTKDDLQKAMEEMARNYQDEAWLEKNLYPYM